MAAHLRGTK